MTAVTGNLAGRMSRAELAVWRGRVCEGKGVRGEDSGWRGKSFPEGRWCEPGGKCVGMKGFQRCLCGRALKFSGFDTEIRVTFGSQRGNTRLKLRIRRPR